MTLASRLLVALVVVLALAGCDQSAPKPAAVAPPAAPPKPLVVASFYPLYEFARQIAGERAEVVSLVPPGVEPHDWEPSPRDVARVEQAKVFLFNGAGFDAWAERLVANLPAGGPVVLEATAGLPLLASRGRHDHGPKDAPAGAKGTAAGEPRDPHAWLDPVLAQRLVDNVQGALAKGDAANAAAYAEGAQAYKARLAALHDDFEGGLARCARRDIVVSHAAFGYLAHRYRLTQIAVTGVAPEAEPSPADLARITRLARRQKVKYIFFETLVSPKLAETLAREVGAETLVLNPLEGLTPEEARAGKDYLVIMRENLENLRKALECP